MSLCFGSWSRSYTKTREITPRVFAHTKNDKEALCTACMRWIGMSKHGVMVKHTPDGIKRKKTPPLWGTRREKLLQRGVQGAATRRSTPSGACRARTGSSAPARHKTPPPDET